MMLKQLLWKETKRQIYLKYILIVQLFITISFLLSKTSYINFNYRNFWIYVPLAFTFVTQNDIFFYDLTIYIETLLSTPLRINDILKGKSLFILMKSYLLSLILFIFYIFFSLLNNLDNGFINILDLLSMILFILMQYTLSNFLGALVWTKGKKMRVIVIITQSLVLILINCISYKTDILIYLLLILSLVFILNELVLKKFLTKENLIKRSI